MDRQNGYTLLEIIMSMGILCILVAMISGFVLFSLRISTETEEAVKLESHFNHMFFFIEGNIESKASISEIWGKTSKRGMVKNMIDADGRIYLENIRFRFGERLKEDLQEKNEGFGLYVDKYKSGASKYIKYDKNFKNLKGRLHCGNYMEEILVEPAPEGMSFKEAKGIKIIFQNRVGGEVKEFEKTIYFKNWKEKEV